MHHSGTGLVGLRKRDEISVFLVTSAVSPDRAQRSSSRESSIDTTNDIMCSTQDGGDLHPFPVTCSRHGMVRDGQISLVDRARYQNVRP